MVVYPKAADLQRAVFVGTWGDSEIPVYDVPSMHSLNQLVGYVKHINSGNGTVLYRRGWFDQAYTNFATACRMNPANPEYQNALRNAQRSAGRQRNPYNNYSTGGGCDGCDLCSSLICADCCCECMGGDLISCC